MKKNLLTSKKLFLLFLLVSNLVYSQPRLKFLTIASGFDNPSELAFTGDSRIFIGENSGLIKVFNGTEILATPFLDLTGKTEPTGNGGLLSIAFHPNYLKNGYFFVYYTEKTSALRTSGAITIARYKVSSNPNVADPASEVVLMKILKPVNADGSIALEHNGGKLNFGKDGNLYFATGDGVEAYPGDPFLNAQNPQSLLGKMIRINVDNFNKAPYYTIPATNPFNYANSNGKKEIWSLGLRNPFRWSFDKTTGDMFIGDVGQEKWEEINYSAYKNPVYVLLDWLIDLLTGKAEKDIINYGWSCYEGTDPYNTSKCNPNQNFVFPAYEYPHTSFDGLEQYAAVIGGYMYRGKQFPELYGYYLSADLYSGNVYFMKKASNGKWATTIQTGYQTGIVTFGEDKDGELYATSLATGELYKIVVVTPATKTSKETSPADSSGAKATENAIVGKSPGADENKRFIPPVFDENQSFKIYPSIVTTGSFKLALSKPALSMQIFTLDGVLVYEKNLKNLSGTISVDVPKLLRGSYYVKITAPFRVETKKIIVQ